MFKTIRFVLKNSFGATKNFLIFYIILESLIAVGFVANNYIFKNIVEVATVDASIDKIKYFVILFVIFQILIKIVDGISKYFWNVIHARQMVYYNKLIIEKISSLDVSIFENSHSVGLINRAYSRIGQAPFYLSGIIDLFTSLIIFIVTISVFVFSQPITAFIIVFTNVFPLIVRSKLAKSSFRLYMADDETKRKFGYTAELITDRSSLVEVKISQAFKYIENRFLSLYKSFIQKQLEIEKKFQVLMTLVEILPIIGLSLYFLQITSQLFNTEISVGTFVFLFANTIIFSNALKSLSQNFDFLQQDGLPLSEIEDFFSLKSNVIFQAIDSKTKRVDSHLENPNIKFENVSFKYPNSNEYIFEDLNLEIPFGQKTAIIGENGAGKSTLIKLLMRVYDVTKGDIFINKVNIRDIPEEYLYKLFSPLFQDFAKFHLTVRENFELVTGEKVSDRKIKDLLIFSNAYGFINKTTNRYDQQLGPEFSNGIDLSGGQWQRLAISRAFSQNKPILILDEPTSAVDIRNEDEIFQRINKHLNNKTLIYISHRFSTIKDAERIIVLDDGNIIEDGEHDELMNNHGKYFELYSIQRNRIRV
jgi:ABC-type multidrug transport system fused ATPase/permease subunit